CPCLGARASRPHGPKRAGRPRSQRSNPELIFWSCSIRRHPPCIAAAARIPTSPRPRRIRITPAGARLVPLAEDDRAVERVLNASIDLNGQAGAKGCLETLQ